MGEKDNTNKKVQPQRSNLLDHFIQRNLTTKMQEVEEKAIAKAIRTLLKDEEGETPSFH
ncbi:hypothetical protein PBV87_08185 [Niameybacter massiliensis]|uniref:Uncharacterized protein n=1 Tax=Holtiella tumoricola TaxID=3018743 RepID=A0AA42DM25_9FIRM|nr:MULTISPECIES: hypothetical protein [Lachnospirales]MDA3731454.1 hypothetical protein [Holtiella tumoricola]